MKLKEGKETKSLGPRHGLAARDSPLDNGGGGRIRGDDGEKAHADLFEWAVYVLGTT